MNIDKAFEQAINEILDNPATVKPLETLSLRKIERIMMFLQMEVSERARLAEYYQKENK